MKSIVLDEETPLLLPSPLKGRGECETMSSTTFAQSAQMPAEWRDFLALTKPRVMTLVVFTAWCGLLVAPGHIHPVLAFAAILCIAPVSLYTSPSPRD